MGVIIEDCLRPIYYRVGESINGKMEEYIEEHGYRIRWKAKESLDGKIVIIVRIIIIIMTYN